MAGRKKNDKKQNILRIREILDENGWSIQYLADRMGVSRPYVSDIIAERKGVSMNALMRVANALNRPVSMLFKDFYDALWSLRVECPNCGATIDYDLAPCCFQLINESERWADRMEDLRRMEEEEQILKNSTDDVPIINLGNMSDEKEM